MLKTRLNLASILAATLAASPLVGLGPGGRAPRGMARDYGYRRPANRYPEQSSRQAMRGHRRAQGGPGITLQAGTFAYAPKAGD